MTTARFALSALCCVVLGQFTDHTTVGALTFTARTVTNDFAAGRDVCVEDMNGDGRLDIVAGGGYEVSWWENLGYDSFTEHVITDQVGIARSVRAADVDGNGEMDVVGAIWQQNRVVWWKNEGDEDFTEVNVDEAFVGPHTVDVKDLNGDGRMDVLCSGFDMSGAFSEIAWWENAGNGGASRRTPALRTGAAVQPIERFRQQAVLRRPIPQSPAGRRRATPGGRARARSSDPARRPASVRGRHRRRWRGRWRPVCRR